jgi:hypothetical protein
LLEELPQDGERVNDQVIRHIPALVTQKQNELLMRTVEMLELEEVVKQMEGGKAPGPDGL